MRILAVVLLAAALAACARAPSHIARPAGAGPFGAALLVPGCAGPGSHTERAARELTRAGFAIALAPAICGTNAEAAVPAIAREAARLAASPGVDRRRLHLIGWSEGGAGVMAALARSGARSAAAFYPACASVRDWVPAVPFLMILAENDTTAPPAACLDLMGRTPDAQNVLAIRYGGVAHGFDNAGHPADPGSIWAFWRTRPSGSYNPAVRDAALSDLRIFLEGSEPK
ncbi:MAG: dienelactone hydrolase family protein [Tagaea sp.]|nr:dienelactone hydrolase family protein [Tagaea sp.]